MKFNDSPFEQMNSMMEQMRRSMLGEFAAPDRETHGHSDWHTGGFDSNISVDETDDAYVVVADLPGFERENLSIRFEDGILTIEGETEVSEDAGPVSHRRSRRAYERLSFPDSVIEGDISASYHNGVLEVTLPIDADHDNDDAHAIDIE